MQGKGATAFDFPMILSHNEDFIHTQPYKHIKSQMYREGG
jgi:hypothetical protein